MSSTITAIVIVALLSAWHLHTRRHPYWRASRDARFYITLGYPATAIAAYWLTASPTSTHWEWGVGSLWALVAAIAFVIGFNALGDVRLQHRDASDALESISAPTPVP